MKIGDLRGVAGHGSALPIPLIITFFLILPVIPASSHWQRTMGPLCEIRTHLAFRHKGRRLRRLVRREATAVKNLNLSLKVGALLLGVLAGLSSESRAQGLLVPPAGGAGIGSAEMEMPTLLNSGSGTRGAVTSESLPTIELPDDSTGSLQAPSSSVLSEPISAGDLQPGLEPLANGHEFVFDHEPAILESTGTWLRRGFWYTEIDAVVMDLIRRRDNSALMFQTIGNSPLTGLPVTNQLMVNGGAQGAEGLPRLKLGRFLFRDHKNRDHAAEMIFYGGGQWSNSGRLDAVAGGTLSTVPSFGSLPAAALTNSLNIDFDGATSSQYDYDSRFNSFELNYSVKSRMRKDRMELEPSGHWVRRAQPSVSRSLMAGIRYFDLNESLNWDAFGIDDDNDATTAAQSGNYNVVTDNDMIGPQVGIGWTYETARWSLGLNTKGGMFLNHTDVESDFEVTGGVTSGSNDITVDNLSFVMESALVAKWHLRPNFSLRTGFEILYATSVAQASEQLNFIPVSTSQVIASGDATYMGGIIGFEGYW